MPATRTMNADMAEPVKIPIDGYDWRKYGENQVKSPEGSRSYYRCKYSACRVKKVEYCDQFNSITKVVYKGEHKHDPPKRGILKGGEVLSTEISLKRKSVSTTGLKEDPIEVVHIDHSKTNQRLTRNSSESSLRKCTKKPDQKDTTGSESLSASKSVKTPTDSYAWTKYGQKQVKSPEGSRSYYKCKYNACDAKKLEFCDQFNSITKVVYKGEHRHDSPKRVILKGGKVKSTAKSLKRKSISTSGLKEHPIEVAHSEKKKRLKRNNSESSVKHPKKPDQKDTTGSKSLSASEPAKISIDSYAWIKYGQKQVKDPEGFRSYYKCKYSACRAKKVQFCDQFNSIINVVYKGQHKHDPPKRVILKGGKVISTAKSLKRKSISTSRLKEHPIEVVHIDDSEIKQRLKRNISESSVLKRPKKPGQKDTTGSESLSASKPVKIPIDRYNWRKYCQRKVKSPEGSRSYYACKYSACHARKVESCDQFKSVINVVYNGEHKHDPPKRVILKGGEDTSTAKSLKRKSVSTSGLKEHPIEIAHIDDSEIKQRLKRSSSESSVLKHPKKRDQKDTTGSESLSASKPVKIPIDSYNWRKYCQRKVTSPEGSRNYYACKYSACRARKVESCDQFKSVINVVYNGEHTHDPPKRVSLKGGEVTSTAKSLKGKSISTPGLKENLIEFVLIDESEIKQRLKRSCSESSVLKHTKKTDQKDTAGSESLSASKPVKIPIDSYNWRKYSQRKLKSPEGSRSYYYTCKYSACRAKKVESFDQFKSVINVVYNGEHKHDPPKRVILKGGEVTSTAKSLKRKSISTPELKENLIEFVHIDYSEMKQRLKRKNSESSLLKHPKKPKFVVHAAVDMGVSADGYKWRKYGQKMVKGNPHPRNCYKCTYAGCTIKKHIEKVVDGSSQVIITYKGLHNHEIPVPKK